jgi:hypothetical protein
LLLFDLDLIITVRESNSSIPNLEVNMIAIVHISQEVIRKPLVNDRAHLLTGD